jgi:ABC-type oligopeptide transport system ATPase subunit
VFQDPFSPLNPRMTVRAIVREPLLGHAVGDAAEREPRIRELLDLRGVPQRYAGRCPHELSGGQRQRVGIARALALKPELVVLDEAVSALDVSIRAQILNLFGEFKDALGLTDLFIGHHLAVVRHLCDRLAMMSLGKLAEIGTADAVFDDLQHPCTCALLGAMPLPDATRERARRAGDPGRGGRCDETAFGRRLPSALPAGGRTLQGRGAADDAARQEAPERLPSGAAGALRTGGVSARATIA